MDVAVLHQRAEQWRQKLLAVTGHRRNGTSGDHQAPSRGPQ